MAKTTKTAKVSKNTATDKAKAKKTAARERLIAQVVALKTDGLSFREIEVKLSKVLGEPNKGFKAFRLYRLAVPKVAPKAVKATKAKATRKGRPAAAAVEAAQ